MTAMMTSPKDENFQALLADYMAEPEDAGFSENIIKTIQTQPRRHIDSDQLARLRTGFLMGGCFMGGVIAATQIKSGWSLLTGIVLPSGPVWLLALFTLFIFAVWVSLDNRDAGTL